MVGAGVWTALDEDGCGVAGKVVVVVVESLHPNQPGVLQVVVVLAVVEVSVVVAVVVVLSSRHPHQPGVLHVEVLVFEVLVAVDDDDELGSPSVPFPSINFHRKQS
jgi:hypothetical protein